MIKVMAQISGVSYKKLVEEYGTPLFVYDENIIRERYRELYDCFPYKKKVLYYAMKANSNLQILKVLLEEGAWIDAVSPFEVELALKAGFPSEKIMFTVDNMSLEEMQFAINNNILINIGSLPQLEMLGKNFSGSDCCIRFTPGLGAGHHEKMIVGHKLCKFGIEIELVKEVIKLTRKYNLKVIGVHEHTGSGIPVDNMGIFLKNMEKLTQVAKLFPDLEFLDFGSGFNPPYEPNEKRLDLNEFGEEAVKIIKNFNKQYGKEVDLRFEPGKYIVAESCQLLVTVNSVKKTEFYTYAATNSGFNHLVRPVMYYSYHIIKNVSNPRGKKSKYTVVGNICESGDIFAKDRELAEVRDGDILSIENAGAYGMAMASNYNSRPLPAEVMVKDKKHRLIRRRQNFKDLIREQENIDTNYK